ncbi:hypothetical protein JCM8547_000913 [Rhodosporidiobolus lusitaniae]
MSSMAPETKDYLMSLPAELFHDICELASHHEWNEQETPYLELVSKAFLPFARSKRFRHIFLTKSSALLKFVVRWRRAPTSGHSLEGWLNPFDPVHFHNLERHKQLGVLELRVKRKSSTLGRYRPPVEPKKLDTIWSYGLDIHVPLGASPAATDFLQLFPSIFHLRIHEEDKEHVQRRRRFPLTLPRPWWLNTLEMHLVAPPSSFDSLATALMSFTGLRILLFGSNAFDAVLLDILPSLPYLEDLSIVGEFPSLTAQHVKNLLAGAKPLGKLRLLSLSSLQYLFGKPYGPRWKDGFTAQHVYEIFVLAELKHVEVVGFMAENRRVARARRRGGSRRVK